MPRLFTHHSPAGTPGDERVFMDDQGRPWCAALPQRDAPDGALVHRSPRAWHPALPVGTLP